MRALSLFIFLLFPLSLFSHGEGNSFEVQDGSYVIDIGYSVGSFLAGDIVSFDFSLFEENGIPAEFESVWVRIRKDKETLFAGNIAYKDFGGAYATFSFLKKGTYEFQVRYENNEGKIAETTIPIDVAPKDETPEWVRLLGMGGVSGFLLGLLFSYGVSRLRTKTLS